MNETDMQIQWQDGSGESVEIGYFNHNGQQCCGHCGVQGTDHGQYAYKTECTICGYVYGTNETGMDVDEFIRRNADPIWLHQNEMWEYMTDEEES